MRAERPNLLVICSDQQHFQALGHVDPFFDTPALDRFAEQACAFELSFCTSPQCSPSRSSMLTGLYPHRTGVLNNFGQEGGAPLSRPTLARDLRAAGYHTAYFGKWHLGGDAAADEGWLELVKRENDEAVTRNGLEFLGRRREGAEAGPFALFLMYVEPHDVYGVRLEPPAVPAGLEVPLDESWERETFEKKPAVQQYYQRNDTGLDIANAPRATWQAFRAFYRERVRAFDDAAGAILAELEARGLREQTVVLVTSDHGEMDTQHRLIFKGPFMYERLVRVPTLVRVPEAFGGGAPRRIGGHFWLNADLTPTLLELAGCPVPALDGRSAAPLLRGQAGFEPRTRVVGQYHGKGRWVAPIRMLRTARHKYNLYRQWGEELYDLEEDPHELHNLAGQEQAAALQAELRGELEAWMKANQDPFESFEASKLKPPRRQR
jgi:choline-sulfatase